VERIRHWPPSVLILPKKAVIILTVYTTPETERCACKIGTVAKIGSRLRNIGRSRYSPVMGALVRNKRTNSPGFTVTCHNPSFEIMPIRSKRCRLDTDDATKVSIFEACIISSFIQNGITHMVWASFQLTSIVCFVFVCFIIYVFCCDERALFLLDGLHHPTHTHTLPFIRWFVG
jgi:hypothetical protein